MKYAKGKWKIEDMGGRLEITTSYRQRDSKVCIATVEVDFGEPFNQEQIDSAKLIASAPALLEALEAAKSKIECSQRSHERASVILVDEALEIIDAAINQAKG